PRLGAGAERALAAPPEAPVPVARLSNASVHYDVGANFLGRPTHRVHAALGVSFDIRPGETFGLVGESGCGKSTIAKALAGLVPHEGLIEIGGRTLASLTTRGRKDIRRDIQMVFQDPMAALDPRMKVGDAVEEPLVIHRIGTRAERRARTEELFRRVGLTPDQMSRYPH
ncbi:MAG: ATP-binding cassette domain-containing protein, partial [Paracoccus sp. (in: a-proteobacteria)]